MRTPSRVIQGRFQRGRPTLVQVAQPQRQGNAFQIPQSVNLNRQGPGMPLPEALLQKMESFFQADFSNVRVHVGSQAASIGAVAFTTGNDIYFSPGQYNPHSPQGQRLLGHELSHVVQQRQGRVTNPFGQGMAVIQEPHLEAEADRAGIQAARHQPPQAGPAFASSLLQAKLNYRILAPKAGLGGRQHIRIDAIGTGQQVGSVQLQPTPSGRLYISHMYVEPPHRRQGVGTLLVQASLAAGQRQGLEMACLEACPSDRSIALPGLVQLYQKAGFRAVGTSRRGFPFMEHPLNPIQTKRMVETVTIHRVPQATLIQRSNMDLSDVDIPYQTHYFFSKTDYDPKNESTVGTVKLNGVYIAKTFSGGGEHMEDTALQAVRDIIDNKNKKADNNKTLATIYNLTKVKDNVVEIHINKSPCSSKARGAYKAITSNKSKGCTEELIDFELKTYKGYSFHIILACVNLYQPNIKGAKDASKAAIGALINAGVDVEVYNPVDRLEEAKSDVSEYSEPLSPQYLVDEGFSFSTQQEDLFSKQTQNVQDALDEYYN